jgi:hypothetical protein
MVIGGVGDDWTMVKKAVVSVSQSGSGYLMVDGLLWDLEFGNIIAL